MEWLEESTSASTCRSPYADRATIAASSEQGSMTEDCRSLGGGVSPPPQDPAIMSAMPRYLQAQAAQQRTTATAGTPVTGGRPHLGGAGSQQAQDVLEKVFKPWCKQRACQLFRFAHRRFANGEGRGGIIFQFNRTSEAASGSWPTDESGWKYLRQRDVVGLGIKTNHVYAAVQRYTPQQQCVVIAMVKEAKFDRFYFLNCPKSALPADAPRLRGRGAVGEDVETSPRTVVPPGATASTAAGSTTAAALAAPYEAGVVALAVAAALEIKVPGVIEMPSAVAGEKELSSGAAVQPAAVAPAASGFVPRAAAAAGPSS